MRPDESWYDEYTARVTAGGEVSHCPPAPSGFGVVEAALSWCCIIVCWHENPWEDNICLAGYMRRGFRCG